MLFKNVSELIQAAEENNIPIAEVMIRQEVEETGKPREEILQRWDVTWTSWKNPLKMD